MPNPMSATSSFSPPKRSLLIAESQDEKMYRVVMDREKWFHVVMGEDYKVDVRTTEKLANRILFPAAAAAELAFQLGVV